MTETWKKISPESNIWKPTVPGEELIGTVVGKRTDGKFGLQVVMMTKEKKKIQTPSHLSLQVRLADIEIGEVIKIAYNGSGEAEVGKNAPQLYDVWKAE